jgi:glycosyltransferase involved in cell wall biosynthesis
MAGAAEARMKVLLVSGSFPPLACGVGDYTQRLASALRASPGIDVGVLTSIGAESSEGEAIRMFARMKTWRVAEAPTFLRVLKEWAPDVLHIQYPTQGYGHGRLPSLIPLLACTRGVRVVRTWHEAPGVRRTPGFLLEILPAGRNIVVRPNFRRLSHPANRWLLDRFGLRYIMGASAIPPSRLSDAARRKLRNSLLDGRNRLIVFFGFLYPFKGVELLFQIGDPERDRIVIAGAPDVDPDYRASLEALAAQPPWNGEVRFAGYMPDAAVADLLAAADVVVLPFLRGGGTWNSSIHAAVLQGTPVVSTSTEWTGFDEDNNLYLARPGDVADMRAGLDRVAGKRRAIDRDATGEQWRRIAEDHLAVYREVLRNPSIEGSAA